MNVLHIVGGDLTRGAHRGAYWLHKALLKLGVRSTVLGPVAADQTSQAVVSTTDTFRGKSLGLAARYSTSAARVLYRDRALMPFSIGAPGMELRKHPAVLAADIVNVHWIAKGPLSIRGLARLGRPTVWTLRDMWPFTGGCHYALECTRYQDRCGACPQLGSDRSVDLSRLVWMAKKRYYQPEISLVGCSTWLSACAARSSLFGGRPVKTIPNCVDTEAFFPVDQITARRALSLPPDRKVVLVGAEAVTSWLKGFDLVEQALHVLSDPSITLLLFGAGKPRLGDFVSDVRDLGYVSSDITMRLAYSAADVFVAPSRQEAFGKTLAESLCCGTPVVAFGATGPRDIVTHQQTGYLAEPFEARDLANGISWVLRQDNASGIRDKCSAEGLERFSEQVVATQYHDHYQEVLGCSTRSALGGEA